MQRLFALIAFAGLVALTAVLLGGDATRSATVSPQESFSLDELFIQLKFLRHDVRTVAGARVGHLQRLRELRVRWLELRVEVEAHAEVLDPKRRASLRGFHASIGDRLHAALKEKGP